MKMMMIMMMMMQEQRRQRKNEAKKASKMYPKATFIFRKQNTEKKQ